MALFKIFRGPENLLNQIPCHEGYAYFTEDKNNLYIDLADTEGSRVQVNAYSAETADTLRKLKQDGVTYDYIDVDDIFLANMTATVAQGGTGHNTLTANALLVGNDTNAVKMVSVDANALVVGDTTNGVAGLKATAAAVLTTTTAGVPQFVTKLPITLGGTNATTAADARTNLDVYSKGEVNTAVGQVETKAYEVTLSAGAWVQSGANYVYNYSNSALRCGKNGNVSPIVTYTSNLEEYSKITSAQATAGTGIQFVSSQQIENDIGIIVIDIG